MTFNRRSFGRRLTGRESQTLNAVIREHLTTAVPVGSRTVARHTVPAVSAATIRNTMMDLEEMGLLSQPHTSAGREPTALGYRVYVDRLAREAHEVVAQHKRLRTLLLEQIRDRDADTILTEIAHALANVSELLGIAFLPTFDEAVLESLELVPVSADRILVVVSLRSGLVRTVKVAVKQPLNRDVLYATARALNERLSGLTISQVRREARARVRSIPHGDSRVLQVFVDAADDIFDLNAASDLHLEGQTNLVIQPEFADRQRLTDFLNLLQHPTLVNTLRSQIGQEGVQVSIGDENPIPELAACSVVSRTYRLGQVAGIMAVVGPMRMPYPTMLALLDVAGDIVEELVN